MAAAFVRLPPKLRFPPILREVGVRCRRPHRLRQLRLAPEHRLPAAYQDSVSALQWLHRESTSSSRGEKADPWFDSHADFSKVFLMGDSPGGNIAHRLGMWAGRQDWGGDM